MASRERKEEISDEDIKKVMKDIKRKYHGVERPYSYFVKTIEGRVTGVHNDSSVKLQDVGEIRIGSVQESVRTREEYVELDIDSSNPVRKLRYNGAANVFVGDSVKAYIFAAKRTGTRYGNSYGFGDESYDRTIHTKRRLKSEEIAERIELDSKTFGRRTCGHVPEISVLSNE